MRAALFALCLVLAAVFVVVGISSWSTGAAWIAAGVLLAPLSWAILSEPATPKRGGLRRLLLALLAEPAPVADPATEGDA